MSAAQARNSVEMVNLLVEKGASVNQARKKVSALWCMPRVG